MTLSKLNRSVARSLAVVVAGFAVAAPARAQEVEGLWTTIQKAGVLRCGAAIAPPGLMRDPATGEYSGTFAELCRQFADVLKVKAQFVDTTWDNIVAGLQADKWDVALDLNRTPTRALAITFSEPVVRYEISMMFSKGSPKVGTPHSLADVDKPGLSIAVMSGTPQDKAVSAAVRNATVVRLPTSDETHLALLSNRADVIADDDDSNQLFAAQNPGTTTTLKLYPALAKQGIGFGLRRGTSPADLQVLNIFIEEKVATGAIDLLVSDSVAKELAANK